MNKTDLEHRLLKGSELYFENHPIYKISLGKMVDFGYSKAQSIIGILCMDDEKTRALLPENITPSTYLMMAFNLYREQKQMEAGILPENFEDTPLWISIPVFLELLFRKHVIFQLDSGFIIGNEPDDFFILGSHNYGSFREIIRERFCLTDSEDWNEENPADARTKSLLERRKKLREKVSKLKSNVGSDENEGLSMADLISIFAEAEHLPLQDVYDKYDIYQFNNQFNRLKIMDDYHVNIQALLAGAKSEELHMQHWLTKIKKP
ncbi:hypothetical protein LQE92_07580 [Lacrimispora sp. NSJ-141]|uniref:Uncharacterized protein n=1 Tax=Lientehia hominis TaxID=2897778 RepID=A0AAP2W8U5_9FIRM|nr:hypothetical protein [Lientehia hominis]MCD2492491.1 hypothetical protein [Lientehia hominis]